MSRVPNWRVEWILAWKIALNLNLVNNGIRTNIEFLSTGCQHAPGIGRATAELIIDSQYTTVDLTRFGFDRFLLNERIVDFNVY